MPFAMPMLSRRRLLGQTGALLSAAALTPFPVLAASAAGGSTAVAAGGPTAWMTDGVEKNLPVLTIEGRLPAGLAGTFYRNGPAGHSVDGVRYRHWFDGDGMVQGWRITPDNVSYASRYVRTHKRTAEQAAGRALFPAFGTALSAAGSAALVGPGRLNPANISVLPVNGRLLALWEAGPAWEIDPQTLETKGEIAWRDDLAGLAFSAHPKIDPNGDIWNFGVNYPGGEMMVWRIGPDGGLKHFAVLPQRHPGLLHDVAITEKSLIFVLTPYFLAPARLAAGESFLDSHQWRPDLPLRILAVDKDDPSRIRTWEAPAAFGFHFSNAWEEADGTIHFDFTLAADPGLVARRLAAVMQGRWEPTAPIRLTAFTLHPGGRVETAALSDGGSEFPRIDLQQVGRRHDAVFHLEIYGGGEWFNTVVRRDGGGGTTGAYRYADGLIPEEHLYVPRPGGTRTGDGWVIGTVIDRPGDRHGLTVFDAGHLADGPLAVAWMGGAQPPGLHGSFVSA